MSARSSHEASLVNFQAQVSVKITYRELKKKW